MKQSPKHRFKPSEQIRRTSLQVTRVKAVSVSTAQQSVSTAQQHRVGPIFGPRSVSQKLSQKIRISGNDYGLAET